MKEMAAKPQRGRRDGSPEEAVLKEQQR